MNRKAQAVAEIAIFGSLLLLILGVLLSYTRSFREQQRLDQNVFRQALYDAYRYEFKFEDAAGEIQTGYGRSKTYSRTIDRQAGVIFEPNRRSYSSSYSVYASGAMEPPDSSETFINQDKVIMPPKRKLVIWRTDGAEDIPEEELQMNTMDVIATIAPLAVDGFIWAAEKKYLGKWFAEWAAGSSLPVATLSLAAKAASFAYLTARYNETIDMLEETEQNREDLKPQDDLYQKWGWRISNDDEDEGTSGMQLDRSMVDNIEGGKWYVKEINAQVYDTAYDASTEYAYADNKVEDDTQIINNRQIDLTDTVNRSFRLRFDMTGPDPTIEERDYDEDLEDVAINQGYGANGVYDEDYLDTTVTKRTQWTTEH